MILADPVCIALKMAADVLIETCPGVETWAMNSSISDPRKTLPVEETVIASEAVRSMSSRCAISIPVRGAKALRGFNATWVKCAVFVREATTFDSWRRSVDCVTSAIVQNSPSFVPPAPFN